MRMTQPLSDGTIAYVHTHPVVKDADYTIMQTLYDAFPDERQALYEMYRRVRQERSLATDRSRLIFPEPSRSGAASAASCHSRGVPAPGDGSVGTGVEELDSQRRWWRAVEICCHLCLTATQVARLDALFERELPQRVQRHREIQDLDRHLARVIEHDNGDDSHVAHLSEQVEAPRGGRTSAAPSCYLRYQTLTQEQRTLFAHMHRSGKLPEPEPGGPGRH